MQVPTAWVPGPWESARRAGAPSMQTLRPAHSFCRRPASGTAASYRESLPCREIRTRHFRAEERRSPNRRRASVMFHPFGRRASGTPGGFPWLTLPITPTNWSLARLDGLLGARPALASASPRKTARTAASPFPVRAAGRHRAAVAASTARTATSAVEPTHAEPSRAVKGDTTVIKAIDEMLKLWAEEMHAQAATEAATPAAT